MEITFEVKGKPVAKARPRVTMRGGFARAYTPKKTHDYENLIKLAFREQIGDFKCIEDEPLEVEITFYFQYPKSCPKYKRNSGIQHIKKPDIDNLIKSAMDALNGIVYKDDSQIVSITACKKYTEGSDYTHIKIKL